MSTLDDQELGEMTQTAESVNSPKSKRKPRRKPVVYNDKIGLRICEQIAQGISLRTICKHRDMPNISTVFVWKRTIPGFNEQYENSRRDQADSGYEDLVELESRVEAGLLDTSRASWLQNSIKWRMGRLKPKEYGDQQGLIGQGGVTINVLPVATKELQAIDITPVKPAPYIIGANETGDKPDIMAKKPGVKAARKPKKTRKTAKSKTKRPKKQAKRDG